MSRDVAIQLIGYVGMAFFLVSYQIKSNKALFLCQLIGSFIFSVQLVLLHAYTGALSLAVNLLKNLLLFKSGDWEWVKSKKTMSVLLALLVIITIFTWDGPRSLLPCVAIAATTIGYWTNNAQKIRASQLIGSPCYLVYDVIARSWAGALCESIVIISVLVSIARFGWKNLGENTEFK